MWKILLENCRLDCLTMPSKTFRCFHQWLKVNDVNRYPTKTILEGLNVGSRTIPNDFTEQSGSEASHEYDTPIPVFPSS